MKKILFSILALTGFFSANAQLDPGCKAQNFTFTALNNGGQVVDLYSWLDSGKYVFLDVSATWCGPCWSYHTSGALEDLYTQHGPGSASNDVRVVFVEGDGTTSDATMSGGTGSQGPWLQNTPYPMCNPAQAAANAFGDDYEIGYFPTIYMICPDRTIKEVGQLTAANLYALVSPTASCPPKINVDVTPVTASGKLISCTGNFTFDITIKNRGFNNLTAATVNLKNGTSVLGTSPWTGNLTTYQTSGTITVNATGVPAGVDSITVEVIASGDQITTNDKFTVYIDNYTSANASTLPYSENMDGGAKLPTKLGYQDISSMSMFGFYDGINGTTKLVGSNGSNTKGVFVNFYNRPSGATGVLTLGNYNTNTSSSYLYLDFDYASAAYSATAENDQLEVVVSTDCGANWTSKWLKAGSALNTTTNVSTGSYIPSAASQWRHETVDLSSIKNNANAIVAIKATSDYGNYSWLDNIKVSASATPSGLNSIGNSSFDVYPNPANSELFVRGLDGNATFTFADMMGRNVKTITVGNIMNETRLNVADLSKGSYFLKITQDENTSTIPVVIAE